MTLNSGSGATQTAVLASSSFDISRHTTPPIPMPNEPRVAVDVTNLRRADLNLREEINGSPCPELSAASRFALKYDMPPVKMAMLQLVGSWQDSSQGDLLERVYQENSNIVAGLGIDPIPLRTKEDDSRTPAFWKMRAILDVCQLQQYELVWFLDGDVLLTQRVIPIQALWFYHSSFDPSLDMLFAYDHAGINSGNFVVNCRSPTAMEFLEEWDRGAEHISRYYPPLYEQTFLYYALRQGNFWLRRVEHFGGFGALFIREPIVWDDQPLAKSNASMWSTQAVRSRLKHIHEMCSLNTLYSEGLSGRAKIPRWKEGDVAVHFAGIRGEEKFSAINDVLDHRTREVFEYKQYSGIDAAAEYVAKTSPRNLDNENN